MGHGPSAAHVAMTLLNFTDEVDLLLRGERPTWNDNVGRQLQSHPIDIIEENRKFWYSRYTYYLRNYKPIYRSKFSKISNYSIHITINLWIIKFYYMLLKTFHLKYSDIPQNITKNNCR